MDTRYVTIRSNRDGSQRVYWQRPGHPLTRLTTGIWPQQATKLNAEAERGPEAGPYEGTVAWVIARYREADYYVRRADSTKKIYERYLREFAEMWGELPPSALTPKVASAYLRAIPGRPSRKLAAAVLKNVCVAARQHGLMESDPTRDLRLEAPKPRDARWSPDEVDAFLRAAAGQRHGRGLVMGFRLLEYTGQRPIDVLAMRRSDLDGELIHVVQAKTGKKVAVPCHRVLRAALADGMAENSLHLASRDDGRPFPRDLFGDRARRIREQCGLLHLQLRDLRRTAVLRMSDAGVALGDIASVTGHSPSEVRSVLETTYWKGTEAQARRAIRLWEEDEA